MNGFRIWHVLQIEMLATKFYSPANLGKILLSPHKVFCLQYLTTLPDTPIRNLVFEFLAENPGYHDFEALRELVLAEVRLFNLSQSFLTIYATTTAKANEAFAEKILNLLNSLSQIEKQLASIDASSAEGQKLRADASIDMCKILDNGVIECLCPTEI